MTQKHTPGPWFRLTGGDDTHISTSVGSNWMRNRVAKIWVADRADEILITASPDLLQALQGLFKHFHMVRKEWDGSGREEADNVLEFARAAMRKATGE